MKYKFLLKLPYFFILFAACTSKKQPLFKLLPASYTGIHFENTISEKKFTKQTMNEFGYMGGGIGIGDFNKDGKKDIFFCGNQVSSQLYLNKGENKFEDITNPAGISTNTWITGVSIVDINNDGYDDIFLNRYGYMLDKPIRNLLYINQKNNTFKEEGIAYGFTDSASYSTQTVFFDYDNDGDLDMFQINYMLKI
jgi:enediyne biosynthesis protein E4